MSDIQFLNHIQQMRIRIEAIIDELWVQHDWALRNIEQARIIDIDPARILNIIDLLENELAFLPIIDHPQQLVDFADWLLRILAQ
jgi:hypothetical protein